MGASSATGGSGDLGSLGRTKDGKPVGKDQFNSLQSAPVGGTGQVSTVSRSSSKTSQGGGTFNKVQSAPKGGTGVDTLSRKSTRQPQGGSDGTSLKLTKDGLLILPGTSDPVKGPGQGGQPQNEPTVGATRAPTPTQAPSKPTAEKAAEEAPAGLGRVARRRPGASANTLLTLSLAETTRKSLLGI